MRFRSLALFPLVYAALFAVVAWTIGGAEALEPFIDGQLLFVRVLAIGGCLAAVSAFSSGDHLRRAWLWLVVATAAVLVRDVLRLPPWTLSGLFGEHGTTVVVGLGVLSNLALLGGVWLLARAWKVAAISLPGGQGGVTIVTVVIALAALVVGGPGAIHQLRELMAGNWSALVFFLSAVVDILSLCLLAPLLLTTIALRGGLLAWPWALVTASMASWLFYDAAAAFGPLLGLGAFPLTELFRGLAETFLFAAGTAQRLAVGEVREPSS